MMKSLSRISIVFIFFTFVFASENNSFATGENSDGTIQIRKCNQLNQAYHLLILMQSKK